MLILFFWLLFAPFLPTRPVWTVFFFEWLLFNTTERRSLPELGLGVYSRNLIPRLAPLLKGQAGDASAADQIVHIPAVQEFGLYPCLGYLPPRHQAPEPVAQPRHRNPQALRLWKVCESDVRFFYRTVRLFTLSELLIISSLFSGIQCKDFGCRRTQCLVHLLSLLPSPRTDLWRHQLHHQHRYACSSPSLDQAWHDL